MDRNQSIQAIINEMVHRIEEVMHPNKIILFGSYARDTAGPGSDVDLLVVMPIEGSKRKKTIEIYHLLTGVGMPKDIIVATPEEVERYRDVVGTIYCSALREGKVIYERKS